MASTRNLALFFVAALLLVQMPVFSAPLAYIIEQTSKSYDYNGTLLNSSSEGTIEIEVLNTLDVLQNIEVILSTTNNTNLVNNTAYAAVAASPTSGDKTRLYLETNESNSTTTYTFNERYQVDMKLDYSNVAGGKDLGPFENTIIFNLSLNASENLNDIKMNFITSKDTFGQNDSMNITGANSTTGEIEILDTDNDGFFDKLFWNGNLRTSENITITAKITPNTNYGSDFMLVDIDSRETNAYYEQRSTFSGTTFLDRHSLGSVRQGVEITPKQNWTVKGFMKNIAHGQIYHINQWSLYEVDSTTPSVTKSTNENLRPGEIMYTNSYDTNVPTASLDPQTSIAKPTQIYYSAEFDWEVVWGNSNYWGILEETMSLPTLYQMDMSIDKRTDITANNETERILTVTDEIRHIGHSNLQLTKLNVSTQYTNNWTLYEPLAYLKNSTNTTRINVTQVQTELGRYNFLIENISLAQNEVIYLEYELSRGTEDESKEYFFDMHVTGWTGSGTPIEKNLSTSIIVPGTGTSDTGGGGSGGAGIGTEPPVLEIIRKSANDSFISDSILKNNLAFRVIDTGGKGLRDAMFFLYTPIDSALDLKKISLSLTRNGKITILEAEIRKSDERQIGDLNYTEYIVQAMSDSLNGTTFQNDDLISIEYDIELPFGTSSIITRAYGYNYYEDKYFFEDIQTYARREHWKLENVEVKESDWEPMKILVGTPVRWIKTIEMKNPNTLRVRERYSTQIYQNRLSTKVSESINGTTTEIENEEETSSMNFLIDIAENGISTYLLELTTAPVLETSRDTEIINISENKITFQTTIALKNFAEHDYSNIHLQLDANEILECSHTFTWLSNGTAEILIPNLAAQEETTVNIIYTEEPPKIIADLDKPEYTCGDKINLSLIVVPKTNEGYLEIELTGPNQSRKTLYADLITIDKIPEEKDFDIPITRCETGEYSLQLYYKSEFKTILLEEKKIPITCEESKELPWLIILLLVTTIIILARKSIYKKRTLDSELNRLKKR